MISYDASWTQADLYNIVTSSKANSCYLMLDMINHIQESQGESRDNIGGKKKLCALVSSIRVTHNSY